MTSKRKKNFHSNQGVKSSPKATAPSSGKKGGASVNNEVKVDPKEPIPFEKKNSFARVDGEWDEQYIPYLNEEDNFADLLLDASVKSNTTQLCYSSIVDYVVGEGVDYEDDKAEDFWSFIDTCNAYGESLDDIRKAAHSDLKTFGNAFLLVIRYKVGSEKKVYVYHLEFRECRLKHNKGKYPTEMYHSLSFTADFNDFIFNEKKAKTYPIYNSARAKESENWVIDSEDKSKEYTVIHLKNKSAGFAYYGIPSSIGSLLYQILEYKGARYNLDDFDNNLVIGGTIVLQGSFSQAECSAIAKRIISQHVGDGKRGRWNVVASERGIENSKVIPYDRNEDGDFLEADKRWEKKIVAANKWDQALCSLQESGGISNNNGTYLRQIYNAKNKTVIKPLQNYERKRFLRPLVEILNDWCGWKVDYEKLSIKPLIPFDFGDEISVNNVMTVNEGRELLGLEPLENEEKGSRFISETKKQESNVQP